MKNRVSISVVSMVLGMIAGIGSILGIQAYIDFMRHSKAPVAIYHMADIAWGEEDYYNEHGEFLECGPVPDHVPDHNTPEPWPGDSCFSRLVSEGSKMVAAQFQVKKIGGEAYLITAIVDLGDGYQVYTHMRGGPIYSLGDERANTWALPSKAELASLGW